MTENGENGRVSPGEEAAKSEGPGSSDADGRATPKPVKRGLLDNLSFMDILKLVTLILTVLGATVGAYWTYSNQAEKLGAAAAERDREVDAQLNLMRTGVLHLHSFQPDVVPYLAERQILPPELRVRIEIARCEVANGRFDAIAANCVAADSLLVGSPVPSGHGLPTSPATSPPAVALSPPPEQQPR